MMIGFSEVMGDSETEGLPEDKLRLVEAACEGFQSDRYGPNDFRNGCEVRIYSMRGNDKHVLVKEGTVGDVDARRFNQGRECPALELISRRTGRLVGDGIKWSRYPKRGKQKVFYVRIGYFEEIE